MDSEKIKKGLLKKLKELNVPQQDIDKALLDFDALAFDINEPKTLESFAEKLVENVAYKNNIAPSDGIEEYRKIFPEIWGTKAPSDKDIEDFLNEEIGNPDEKVTENPDGSTTKRGPGYEINENVPLEEFKSMFSGRPSDYKMPEILNDLKDTDEYSRAQFQLWSFEAEYQDRQKFKKLINQQYEIFYEYLKENPDLPIEDKKILLDELRTRTLVFDEQYKDITVKNDVDLSLEELNTFDTLIQNDANNLKNEILPNMLEDAKIGDLDFTSPDSETILEQMDDQETGNADRISQEYSESIEPRPGEVDNFVDNEFNQIVENEQKTNWWRYDDSTPEFEDYMERYTSGDLTDEELADLKEQHEEFKNGSEAYDADVEEVANKAGIKDTKAFRFIIQAGTKLLQAIDEELLYSPLLLAGKGLEKLGLGLAGKAVGGVTRAALAYEDLLFKANVGIAALAHGSLAATGTASRLPTDIANGIANLYGAGMPQEIIPQAEGGMSKEEQAKRHQTWFLNQLNLYTNMSPVMASFRYLIEPKTGITDPIEFYKQVPTGFDRIGKMLGGND